MKYFPFAAVFLALAPGACAHAPEPYRFTAKPVANDLDLVVKTLEGDGLKPAKIDRQKAAVTTQWFDTGYRFREIDDFRNLDYYTDVFLRYRVSIQRHGDEDTVELDVDVKRCSPTDSYVTSDGVIGSCQAMTVLLPTHQRQARELGDKLRLALAAARSSPA